MKRRYSELSVYAAIVGTLAFLISIVNFLILIAK